MASEGVASETPKRTIFFRNLTFYLLNLVEEVPLLTFKIQYPQK